MNDTNSRARDQAPHFVCAGCHAPLGGIHGLALFRVGDRVGRACQACYTKAATQPRFRDQVETAVAAGTTLPEVQRGYAALGVFDVPTTPDEADEALGLAIGSTLAALGRG